MLILLTYADREHKPELIDIPMDDYLRQLYYHQRRLPGCFEPRPDLTEAELAAVHAKRCYVCRPEGGTVRAKTPDNLEFHVMVWTARHTAPH